MDNHLNTFSLNHCSNFRHVQLQGEVCRTDVRTMRGRIWQRQECSKSLMKFVQIKDFNQLIFARN